MMSHYIADVAVFAHVMGSATDWGAETGNVHSNYESYVNTRTSEYIDTYNSYLSYDGTLVSLTVYDATLNVARDTTFDNGGSYNYLDELKPTTPLILLIGIELENRLT